MRIDEKTGVPAVIYNIQSKQYSGTPEQIAWQYLNENSTLLKMDKNLIQKKMLTEVYITVRIACRGPQ